MDHYTKFNHNDQSVEENLRHTREIAQLVNENKVERPERKEDSPKDHETIKRYNGKGIGCYLYQVITYLFFFSNFLILD